MSLTGQILGPFRGRTRGEQIAFLLFLFTCFQAAVLVPYITLVPGERTNLFTGLLCGLSLAACMAISWDKRSKPSVAVWASLLLGILVLLSSALSPTPHLSMFRGLAVVAAGAGGFWCARFFFGDSDRLNWFVGFCLGLMSIVIILALIGCAVDGRITCLLGGNLHQPVSVLFLLSFAPLAMCLSGDRHRIIAGFLVLVGAGLVLYLSTLRSAILIPVLVAFVAVTMAGKYRLLKALFVAVFGVGMLFLLFQSFPDRKLKVLNYEPVYYRAESYPFSLHIALKHPLLGNGLRAPRDAYLEDYALKFNLSSRTAFIQSVKNIGTSENIFLTFLADLGFPFLIIYVVSVVVLVSGAVCRTGGAAGVWANTMLYAACLAFACGLLHCLTTDDLLIPQVSWFFHILLGIVSVAFANGGPEKSDQLAGRK